MARPSSNKGKVGFSADTKARIGSRIRVDSSEGKTGNLFPETESYDDRSLPESRSKGSFIQSPNSSEDSRFTDESIITDPRSERQHRVVPKSLVKFVVALFLAPLAWVLTQTFFQAFTTSLSHGLLATQSFGCFTAGMILFVILYLITPQNVLMYVYVFGHEVTHALWAKLFGGRVADHFHVSLEGGHVLTDRVNTWIALAPYFFPI